MRRLKTRCRLHRIDEFMGVFVYLCYDIKGIQQFIFSVPRLKCVVGASGLIVAFDQWAKDKADVLDGVEAIFAAGGRGAFFCRDTPDQVIAKQLEQELIEEAWSSGLDLRIGLDADFTQSLNRADRLYPYTEIDESSQAEPCAMSGLWPVIPGAGEGPNHDIHPLIWERVERSRSDELGQWILDGWKEGGWLPRQLHGFELQFLKNVSPHLDDSEAEHAEAKVAQMALGRRNRWAVIAMDGNDMGRQFLAFEDVGKDADGKLAWLKQTSQALEDCTHRAFFAALSRTIEHWANEVESSGGTFEGYCVPDSNRLVLPFRPLVLGGDDVTMLCHPSYAMAFVEEMAITFRKTSRTSVVEPRWPATDGELTMSAGILYAKVSFPLHMAIPYAERLLESAKRQFRARPGTRETDAKTPTPAAVDWDTITDTLVEDPEVRRRRELCFRDDEIKVDVQLTQRPYLIESDDQTRSLKALFGLKRDLDKAGIATSVLARILPSLQRPWSERVAFVASIAKRHPLLMEHLWEDGGTLGQGWTKDAENTCRSTGLPDALLLLEEEHRMTQSTIDD